LQFLPQASLRLQSFYLWLPCSWDYRCTPMPGLLIEIGSNSLPRLASNLNPPHLPICHWDYICEPLCLFFF
jgi:hypothetical protein